MSVIQLAKLGVKILGWSVAAPHYVREMLAECRVKPQKPKLDEVDLIRIENVTPEPLFGVELPKSRGITAARRAELVAQERVEYDRAAEAARNEGENALSGQ